MSIDFIKSIYYEFMSYFVPQRIKYQIKGQCNKCGKCCQDIRATGLRNEKEIKFMSIFFPYYKYFYIKGTDENGELILACKHLNKDNTCNIYNKRPYLCRSYPAEQINSNTELLDGCGYEIIKKEFKDYL